MQPLGEYLRPAGMQPPTKGERVPSLCLAQPCGKTIYLADFRTHRSQVAATPQGCGQHDQIVVIA